MMVWIWKKKRGIGALDMPREDIDEGNMIEMVSRRRLGAKVQENKPKHNTSADLTRGADKPPFQLSRRDKNSTQTENIAIKTHVRMGQKEYGCMKENAELSVDFKTANCRSSTQPKATWFEHEQHTTRNSMVGRFILSAAEKRTCELATMRYCALSPQGHLDQELGIHYIRYR